MDLLVDPYLIALPHPTDQPATVFIEYIEVLARWAIILAEKAPTICASEKSINLIIESSRYPYLNEIKSIVAKHNIEIISAVDVSNLIGVMAARRPYLEDRVGVSGVVVHEDAIILPKHLLERLGDEIGNSLKESLFLAAFGMQEEWEVQKLFLGTTAFTELQDAIADNATSDADMAKEDDSVEIVTVHCSGIVTLVERSTGEIEESDVFIEHDYDVVLDTTEVEIEQNWNELYLEPRTATQYAYNHLLSPSDRAGSVLSDIVIGEDFVRSIEELAVVNNVTILRKIFRLAALAGCGRLASLKGAKLHPVRLSHSADAPQVERHDGSKLWRCMVSQRGAGYRLHYWTLAAGGIELEKVLLESQV